MNEILIRIDDKALKALRSHLSVRQLAGHTWGLPEAALVKILDALHDGGSEVELILKKSDD